MRFLQTLILLCLFAVLPTEGSAQPFNPIIKLYRGSNGYAIGIDAQGNVQFERYNSNEGVFRDSVDIGAVENLRSAFRAARFSQLKDEYRYPITDHYYVVLSFADGGAIKEVRDWYGERAGMPHAVIELQDLVDKVTGSDRITLGSTGLVPLLEKNNYDFRSKAAAEALYRYVETASDDTLRGFVTKGAPLNEKIGKYRYGPVIAAAAIRHGRTDLFNLLADRDVLSDAGRYEFETVFARSSAGCDPAMVDAAVARGLKVDAVVKSYGKQDRGKADLGRTALLNLDLQYNCPSEEARIATAKALIERGANINKRGPNGKTILFSNVSKSFLVFLLANGADAKVIDRRGRGVLSGVTDTGKIALLQAAGAKPPQDH